MLIGSLKMEILRSTFKFGVIYNGMVMFLILRGNKLVIIEKNGRNCICT